MLLTLLLLLLIESLSLYFHLYKFSYGRINFFKIISRIIQKFIYLFECKNIFTTQVKLLNKLKITLLAQNTDKNKRKNVSAYYIFTFFKEVVTYHSSIHTFSISIVFLLL